ncbi:hypothetical protein M6D81_09460 [Paenibacillus sp. J5C_2022]|uniref:hypothetical protein n=1 Tax=Paenibacillus sp. J5C2022 TaxID=2977129 RepID=UPI0021D37876|nr:hypothetical protein [Paenibacillus sp. J5C2022]MCU6708946.1 hypothetical protein [Paenibacillus sp. J5C2022]
MNSSLKTAFWVVLYAFLAGFALALFAQITPIIRYAFSLLALVIGIRFFRLYDTIGLRVAFIVTAIIFYFLVAIAFAIYQYMRENPDMMTSML